MWFVYILNCSDGKLYTGCAEDIDERLNRHRSGYVNATTTLNPQYIKEWLISDLGQVPMADGISTLQTCLDCRFN